MSKEQKAKELLSMVKFLENTFDHNNLTWADREVVSAAFHVKGALMKLDSVLNRKLSKIKS